MEKTKFLTRFWVLALILHFMLIPNTKAQQLSDDPLYVLKFLDHFDSTALRYQYWRTGWYWGPNMPNSNMTKSCSNFQPDSIVDWAYNSQLPYDTNRSFTNSGGLHYQRMFFNKENFNAPITVYHKPCNAPICSGHPCDNNLNICYYDSLEPFKYSGAMMLGRQKFKYGYIEMKYRLKNIAASQYNAYGPNLWMWAGDADSAKYSEIDIFEQEGRNWTMDMNYHYRMFDPATHPNPANPGDTVFWHGKGNNPPYEPYTDRYTGPYNGGTWHTVGCEWTPDHIDSYYDSNDTIRRYSISKLPYLPHLTAMPLVIDCYMPAAQYCIPFRPGYTDPNFYYDIEYVKVYQINQVNNCSSTSGNFPSFTTNNYTSKLYRDLTVGGGGSAILNSGSFHLAGQDYVLLQSGFESSGTATVIISTTPCQWDQKVVYDNARSSDYEPIEESTMKDMLKAKQH
jgi:hypothetical protein